MINLLIQALNQFDSTKDHEIEACEMILQRIKTKFKNRKNQIDSDIRRAQQIEELNKINECQDPEIIKKWFSGLSRDKKKAIISLTIVYDLNNDHLNKIISEWTKQ